MPAGTVPGPAVRLSESVPPAKRPWSAPCAATSNGVFATMFPCAEREPVPVKTSPDAASSVSSANCDTVSAPAPTVIVSPRKTSEPEAGATVPGSATPPVFDSVIAPAEKVAAPPACAKPRIAPAWSERAASEPPPKFPLP